MERLLLNIKYFLYLITIIGPLNLLAQFPGCPAINAGVDQTLPCSQTCTNLTAVPFHTGLTNTYAVASIPHTPPIAYNQAGGNAIAVGIDDVWSPVINLPFNFCYYGVNYTTIAVGANGTIRFNPAAGIGGSYHPWPFTASCPDPTLTQAGDIFGAYHDIDPSLGGTIRWYLLGTAPCRIFVVSFNAVPQFSCTTTSTTQMMVLYETTNAIDVYINNKPTCNGWNGGRAIIGIQNPAGTAGIAAPGRNAAANWTINTPEGWRFTPNGAPNYSVAWSQGGTVIGTGNNINVCPGAGLTTYTATVTYDRCDGTQVSSSDNVVIDYAGLPAPTVTPVAETCNNANNGSVTINNPVGAGPYTVSIAGPLTASVVEPNTAVGVANFTGLPDGAYTYSVTGANGCIYNGTFNIAAGPNCCSVTTTSTNALCNGAASGTGTANPAGGTAPYSYAWINGQTSQTATALAAGTYTVIVTDNLGCTANGSVTITQPTAVTGSLSSTNVTCNGGCNGTITATSSGGSGPYQYRINGGAYSGSASFTGLCAGAYSIDVRDNNNCILTLTATITQPTAVTATPGTIVNATCGLNNGSATINASGGIGPYTYNIGGANQAGNSFTGLAPGTYTATVTGTGGCTATTTFTILGVTTPTISIQSQQNVSCFGGVNGSILVAVAGGTGPFQYRLNAGAYQASNVFNALTAGTYTITVRDANACTSSITVTITQPTQLTYTNINTQVTCNGLCNGQIAITASGGTTPYQYSSNSGTTFAPTSPLTGLCAGSYNIVVRDANNCLATSLVTITQPTAISATFVNTSPICAGQCNGTSTVSASGGTPTYQYSANGGALQGANLVSGLCGGNNTIMVQDANGCQFTSVQNIINPPTYGIDTLNVDPSNCGSPNGLAEVQANGLNGPFTYTIDGASPNTTGIFTGLLGGAYLIEATDQLGCTSQLYVGISDVELTGVTLLLEDSDCFGGCNGQIIVTNVNGAAPIGYDFDNSGIFQPTGSYSNYCAGTHAVTIRDGGSCVFIVPFVTGEPDPITFNSSVVNVLCNGASTGQINFSGATGGLGAFQYSIDGGTNFQSGTNFSGLAAGTYNLAVRDDSLCMVTGTATITELAQVSYVYSADNLTCNSNNSGFVQFVGSGGTAPYMFSMDGGTNFQASSAFGSLSAATYNVVVRDANLCTGTGTITITEPPVLSSTYTPTNLVCNGICDGQIAFTALGGTAPYQYSTDNGTTFSLGATISNLCAATYNVRVRDANNCIINGTQSLTEPTAVTFTTIPVNSTCSLANGEIAFTAAGGNGPYNYSINNGTSFVTNNNFTGLTASTYPLAVTDQFGCEATGSQIINNFASPVIIGAAVTNVTCNSNCDGELQVTISGGTAPITYSIGGVPNSNSLITSICAGNYTLTVTDNNNCSVTQAIAVTEPPVLLTTPTVTQPLCFGQNNGSISCSTTGGTPPYQYSPDNGAQFFNSNVLGNLIAGTYTVIVRDANNCQTTNSVVVNQPTELLINTQNSTPASCHAECDGVATITTTGGSGGNSYSWAAGTVGGNAPSANSLCAGSYNVIVTDANSCTVNATLNITEPPILSITSISATNTSCNNVCDGTIFINSPTAVDYSIDGGATYQPLNLFSNLCAGTYSIVVRNSVGCITETQSITITEPAVLVQNLIPEDGMTICYDGYGTLSASASGGTSPYLFIWSTGDTAQYLTVNDTLPATYTCTIEDINGCVSNSVSASILIRPPFIASVTTPVSFCPGTQVSATASGVDGLPGYTYQWLNQAMDTLADGATYNYSPNGNDTLLMVARDECYRYDTLEVIFNEFTVVAPVITADSYTGCSPLQITFTNPMNPTDVSSTTWTMGDGTVLTGNPSVTHTFTNVGCYDVNVNMTTSDGCISDTVFSNLICINPDPIANFTYNPRNPTTVNSNVSFVDESINANLYSWTFGTFGASNQQNPNLTFDGVEEGSVTICLEVTSPDGCVDSICKLIQFDSEFLIFVPNTFTPDQDAFNNSFTPVFPPDSKIQDYTFMIYNRWGEAIFESHNYQVGWDGKYADNPSQDGVYIWTVELKGGSKQELMTFKGHVNLLK